MVEIVNHNYSCIYSRIWELKRKKGKSTLRDRLH